MSHRLQVKDQQGVQEILLIDSITVGRDPRCDINAADPLLSRQHAEFLVSGGQVLVRDLNSRNGIVVNGRRVAQAVLQAGDVVQVAGLAVTFLSSPEPPTMVVPSGAPGDDPTALLTGRQVDEAAAASVPGFARAGVAAGGNGGTGPSGWSVKVADDDRTTKVPAPAPAAVGSRPPLPATIEAPAIAPVARTEAAPRPSGRTLASLLAWTLPFAVLCFGLGVVSIIEWQRAKSPVIVIAGLLLAVSIGTIAALAGRRA